MPPDDMMSDAPIGTVTIEEPANGAEVMTGSTITVSLSVAGFPIVVAGRHDPRHRASPSLPRCRRDRRDGARSRRSGKHRAHGRRLQRIHVRGRTSRESTDSSPSWRTGRTCRSSRWWSTQWSSPSADREQRQRRLSAPVFSTTTRYPPTVLGSVLLRTGGTDVDLEARPAAIGADGGPGHALATHHLAGQLAVGRPSARRTRQLPSTWMPKRWST